MKWEIDNKGFASAPGSPAPSTPAPSTSAPNTPPASFVDARVEISSITPSFNTLPDLPPSPRDPIFGNPPLPLWVKNFRLDQWSAIKQIVTAFDNGSTFVFADLPPGLGKSLVGECVRRLLKTRAVYVCTSISLQEQFVSRDRGFSYAKELRGRANYPTADFPQRLNAHNAWERLSAADCNKEKGGMCSRCSFDEGESANPDAFHCNYCHPIGACGYTQAKVAASDHFLAVLNTAYFLAETNHLGDMSKFSKWPLVIVDEADTSEPQVLNFAELEISPKMLKRLKVGPPRHKTVARSWSEWITNEALPATATALKALPHDSTDIKKIRERKAVLQLRTKLKSLAVEVENGNWIYDSARSGSDTSIIFRPIRVDGIAPEVFWAHGERFLLMSGTIISAEIMADSLGIPPGSFASITADSSFPVENRPIYPIGIANMTFAAKDEEWPKLADGLRGVMNLHPDARILVHTVSYALASFLLGRLNSPRCMTYTRASEREATLNRYKQTRGAVLLAPSLDRGIDLAGDLCDVIVIAKVPYPNRGDKRVQARMYTRGGDLWYAYQAVRSIVQMTGRGMRSKDDRCTTYILDKQFSSNIYHRHKNLFPRWWRAAIVTLNPPNVMRAAQNP